MEKKLEAYYKREERERILGIIEYIRDEMGDSSYELYTIKKLNEIIRTVDAV